MGNGGLVVELMVDDTANPMGVVDTWVTSDGHQINCSVVHDTDGFSNSSLEDIPPGGTNPANREWAFVIDTSNMQIVWRAFGSLGDQEVEDSSAVQGLTEMCELLQCAF
jgi:hypothetical protein